MISRMLIFQPQKLKPIIVITYIIMGVTVAASFFVWDQKQWMDKLTMAPYRINTKKEYYRFMTSAFIHADHMHLLLNMLSLYFFGVAVERILKNLFGSAGGLYFIALYVLAVIVSDIPSYIKYKKSYNYSSLGASGAVSAVIFAFILFRPIADICLYYELCLPGFIMGTAYVVYSYYQGKSSRDNINHDAHLYGALFGLVFCFLIYPESIPEFAEQISNWPLLKKIF